MGWAGRGQVVERLNHISERASKQGATSRILGALFFGPLFMVSVWVVVAVVSIISLAGGMVVLVFRTLGTLIGAVYMLLDVSMLGIYFIYRIVIGVGNEKIDR